MKKNTPLSCVAAWWRRLYVVDRLLLIFMAILLIQSAHSLFFCEQATQNSNALHTVIRTAAASIFGYFISAGFRGGTNRDNIAENTAIGVSTGTETDGEARVKVTVDRSEGLINQRLRQQIIIVALIGIFSLLILVAACNNTTTASDAVAALSQLRDFVSGSIGFLIGHAGAVRNER